MEQPPKYTDLAAMAGISVSYANEIVKGRKVPPRTLAIHILRSTGWRHDSIARLTDEQINLLEQVEPYAPRERDVA